MSDANDPLQRRVAAAYDEVLDEPVPERLSALLAGDDKVVGLGTHREKRRWRPALTWAQLGGMAASLAIGVFVGLQVARGDGLLQERGGELVAGERLAQALDTGLASEPRAGVGVQLTFVDRGGRYCRTFTTAAVAGLACRGDARWSVVATAQAPQAAGDGMRQAGSAIPKAVLDAVDARIEGNALDAQQERAARDRGWRR